MKKYLLITTILLGLVSNNCFAQVEDPLNQNALKVQENSNRQKEEVLTKKKPQKPVENIESVTQPRPAKQIERKIPAIKINNPCPDKITVELKSLTGNLSSQTVTLNMKFINHDVNKKFWLREFKAYNEEGNSFDAPFYSYETFTDVPVNAIINIYGKMLPANNKKLNIISFTLDGCSVEMRDVPIQWQ